MPLPVFFDKQAVWKSEFFQPAPVGLWGSAVLPFQAHRLRASLMVYACKAINVMRIACGVTDAAACQLENKQVDPHAVRLSAIEKVALGPKRMAQTSLLTLSVAMAVHQWCGASQTRTVGISANPQRG